MKGETQSNTYIYRAVVVLLLVTVSLFLLPIGSVFADNEGGIDVDDLNAEINRKAQELNAINKEIKQTQGVINSLTNQKQTLSRDINRFDYTINQLDLSIESSEINLEKLDLELELLEEQKVLLEQTIQNKRGAIADVLQALQKNDNKGFMYLLLENTSLADSVFEIQSLYDLEGRLALRVQELSELHTELVSNIESAGVKQVEVELERQDLAYRKTIIAEQKQEKKAILSVTQNKEAVYQEELAELEAKQSEIEGVIAEIEDRLRAQFDPTALPTERAGVFEDPVKNFIISQCYGATAFARTAYRSGIHSGVDFAVPAGYRVYAVADGVVHHVDNNDVNSWRKYQFGKYVVIDHGNNLSTLYAHLSQYIVANGERVARGQVIGYVGNTGYSTGAHLHFGVYSTATMQFKSIPPAQGVVPLGVHIDPTPYLPSSVERNKCL
jgi:murein DD-endopeptidase MepM/ murein hydrolase activator NlpD